MIKFVIERLLLDSHVEKPLPIRIQHTHCEWEEAVKLDRDLIVWMCCGPEQLDCSLHERGDEMGDDGTPLFTSLFTVYFNHSSTSLMLDLCPLVLCEENKRYFSLVLDRLLGDKKHIAVQVPYNKHKDNYSKFLKDVISSREFKQAGEGTIQVTLPYATKVSYYFFKD